jgi:hypothetical protein
MNASNNSFPAAVEKAGVVIVVEAELLSFGIVASIAMTVEMT